MNSTNCRVENNKHDEKVRLIYKFDKMRSEYLTQLNNLRSKYESDMINVLNQIKELNK